MGVDAAVCVQSAAATVDCVSSLSWCCVRALAVLLSRRVVLNLASVDVRLSVGRGCTSCLARRAVMRMVVSGRGCDCDSPAYIPSTVPSDARNYQHHCHCDCRSTRRKMRRKTRERRGRRRRRGLGHPRFHRRYSLLPVSLPAFLTGSSHDCVSQLCCQKQQSTRHPWNRRQGH